MVRAAVISLVIHPVRLTPSAIVPFNQLPALLQLRETVGFYTIVSERRCRVYVLFGKVLAVLDEPGLHILPTKLGRRAFIVNWLGKCHVLDMRLD